MRVRQASDIDIFLRLEVTTQSKQRGEHLPHVEAWGCGVEARYVLPTFHDECLLDGGRRVCFPLPRCASERVNE